MKKVTLKSLNDYLDEISFLCSDSLIAEREGNKTVIYNACFETIGIFDSPKEAINALKFALKMHNSNLLVIQKCSFKN